jgi:hypothetical protein
MLNHIKRQNNDIASKAALKLIESHNAIPVPHTVAKRILPKLSLIIYQ